MSSPAEPRELVGRYAHQAFLMQRHPGMSPKDTSDAWQGLSPGQREAYMQAGAALFEAGKKAGSEYLSDDLRWLLAAGMEVTVGYVERDAMSQLRVAVDYDGEPEWIVGSLGEGLALAKAFCEEQGISP